MSEKVDPLVGQTIGGCLILEVIGKGGMGVIYKTRQKSLDRVVAIKVLSQKLVHDEAFIERFQREARAIARVNHPRVLAVYDVGEENGTYYMIMEYVDGGNLAELQEKKGVLEIVEACDYIIQAAQGLQAAQAAGIIHRDVKPDNLMLTRRNMIKVSDFGLARQTNSTNTATQTVMGTPAFMSPEQCDGKVVDGRTDVYSLGGSFYKLVTGRLPFEAETAMSMMYRHKHEALIPPHEIIANFPVVLSDIIGKMMEKRREDRFQTMQEIIDVLEDTLYEMEAQSAIDPNRTVVFEDGADEDGGVDDAMKTVPPRSRRMRALSGGATRRQHGVGSSRSSALIPPPIAASPAMPPPPAQPYPQQPPQQPNEQPAPAAPAVPGYPAAGVQMPVEIKSLVDRADELAGRGDRYGAMKAYRRALNIGIPDQQLASELEKQVITEYEKRLELAMNYFEQGRLIEASREFRVCSDLMPDDEDLKARVEELEGQLKLKRETELEINEAIRKEEFEKALELYDQLPEHLRDPGMGQEIIHVRQVLLPTQKLAKEAQQLEKDGDVEAALDVYRRVLTIDPSHYLAKPKAEEIEKRLDRINLLMISARKKSGQRDFKRSALDLEQVLEQDPTNEKAFKLWIDALINAAEKESDEGQIAEAMKTCERIIQVDEKNARARDLLSELRFQRDKENAMVEEATVKFNQKKYAEAKHYWEEVLKINPHHPRAKQAIAAARKKLSKTRVRNITVLLILILSVIITLRGYSEKQQLEKLYSDVLDIDNTKISLKKIEDVYGQRLEETRRALYVYRWFDKGKTPLAIENILDFNTQMVETLQLLGKDRDGRGLLFDNEKLTQYAGDARAEYVDKEGDLRGLNAVKERYVCELKALIEHMQIAEQKLADLKGLDAYDSGRFLEQVKRRRILFEAAVFRYRGFLMEIGLWLDDRTDPEYEKIETVALPLPGSTLPDKFRRIPDADMRLKWAEKYYEAAIGKIEKCSSGVSIDAKLLVEMKRKLEIDKKYLIRYGEIVDESRRSSPDRERIQASFSAMQDSTNYCEHLPPRIIIEMARKYKPEDIHAAAAAAGAEQTDYIAKAMEFFQPFKNIDEAKRRWNRETLQIEELFGGENRNTAQGILSEIRMARTAGERDNARSKLMLYDLWFCRQREMALMFPKAGTFDTSTPEGKEVFKRIREEWSTYREATGSVFCVDRFEYFETGGKPRSALLGQVKPRAMTYIEAKAACQAEGKVLCTQEQWESACTAVGGDKGRLFVAGAESVRDLAGSCAMLNGAVHEAGSPLGKRCMNPIGVYDMVGNLAEWVTSPGNHGVLRGGFADPRNTKPSDLQLRWASCRHQFQPPEQEPTVMSLDPQYVPPKYRGFRCCAPLEGVQR